MRFQDTQLAKVIHEIKLAYLSHVPIVYIPTDQIEFIKELVYSERGIPTVIPHLKCDYEDLAENSCVTNNTPLAGDNYFRNFVPRESIWDKIYSRDNAGNAAFLIDLLSNQNVFVYIGSSWQHECYTSYSKDKHGEEFKTIEQAVTNIIDYALYPKMSWDMYLRPNVSRQSVLNDGLQRSLIVVCTTEEESIPKQLIPYTKIIRVPSLTDEEIYDIIKSTLHNHDIAINAINNSDLQDSDKKLLVEMRGFTKNRIRTLIQTLIYDNLISENHFDLKKSLDVIRTDKKEALNACPGLKWEKTGGVPEATGLGKIIHWLDSYVSIFGDIKKAEDEGLNIPKGILISGIPGSGKSLMAKTAANKLGLPLISLDMGAMRGSHHGESENNLNRALALAESMSPCILWVDEIEKAFSGTSNNSPDGDNGVGKRMFGKFLTWMQEKKSACFVFATANDITSLPPELFRSERFSRKFFTFLPTCEECAKIFANEVKRANEEYLNKISTLTPEQRSSMPKSIFECIMGNESEDEVSNITNVEDEAFWIDILNCVSLKLFKKNTLQFDLGTRNFNVQGKKLEKAYGWRLGDNENLTSGAKEHVKLFTGADISSIFKEICHELWKSKRGGETSNQFRYRAKNVKEVALNTIETYKSYGQTNIRNIVECFLKLYENNFIPASITYLYDFNNYNDEEYMYRVDTNGDKDILLKQISLKEDNDISNEFELSKRDRDMDLAYEVSNYIYLGKNSESIEQPYNIISQLAIISAINYYSPQIKNERNR